MKAEELLEMLNDPKKAERMKSLGWNVEEARIECEKSIASKQAPNE